VVAFGHHDLGAELVGWCPGRHHGQRAQWCRQLFAPSAYQCITTTGQHQRLGRGDGFLVLVFTGALASNVAGRWMVKQWDRLFTHIPVVKPIYTSVKKVSDTLFSSNGNAFRKAVLIQYPRQGAWTIAFQTGVPQGEVQNHLGEGFMSVYVPTTPNPTSGFFLLVPVADAVELDMSVDQALTYVISMGAVSPTVSPTPSP